MRLWPRRLASLLLVTYTPSVGWAQAPVAAREGSLRANGAEIYYRVAGSGPPLMLLHGYLWSGEAWDRFIPELSKHFTLVIPDMRGHGRSGTPADRYRMRDAARDYFSLADHLGLEQFAAVGHSAGANALYFMAVEQPDRVTALVAIGARHAFTEAARRGMRASPSYDSVPAQQRALFDRIHARGRPQIDWLIREFRWLGSNEDDLNLTPAKLGGIKARALIIAGDGEELDVSLVEQRAIRGAQLWVVPGTGHFPFWEEWGGSAPATQIFSRVVREFVSGSAPPRP